MIFGWRGLIKPLTSEPPADFPGATCRLVGRAWIFFIVQIISDQKGQEPTKSGTVQFAEGCLETDPAHGNRGSVSTRDSGAGLRQVSRLIPPQSQPLLATTDCGNNFGVNLDL
jgi:hypothetical protein